MRKYGSGTIIKDNTRQRYVARYTDENLKTHRKVFPLTRQGYRDAEVFLKRINKHKEECISIANDMTLEEWIVKYITLYKVPHLRTQSLTRIKESSVKWINLYPYKLTELQPMMIQKELLKMQNEGLSASSLKKAYNFLKSALQQATAERLIAYNPVDAVPGIRQKRQPVEVFTRRELGKIFLTLHKLEKYKFNNSQRYDMVLFFRLLLTTGMRVSELLALKWEDVHDDYIHVHHSKSINSQTFNDPKTRAGDRRIPYFSKKTKQMLMAKPRGEYVFENKNEGAMTYQRAFLTWQNVRKRTGITKRIHVFRHTFASYLLTSNKIPLANVSAIIGHASPAITLDIYTHAVPYDFEFLF